MSEHTQTYAKGEKKHICYTRSLANLAMGYPVHKGLKNRMIGLLISFIVIGFCNGQQQCNLSPLFSTDYYHDAENTEYPFPYKTLNKTLNDVPVFDTCTIGVKTHYTQKLGGKEDGIFGTCFVQAGASCLGHMSIKYRNISKIARIEKCEFSFADVTITHNCVDFFNHHIMHTKNVTRVYDLTRFIRGSSFIHQLTIEIRKSLMKINFNFTIGNDFISNSRMNNIDMFEYMSAIYKAKIGLSKSVEIYRITMEEEHFSQNPLIYIEGIPQLTYPMAYDQANLTIYYGLVFPNREEYDCHFYIERATMSSLKTIVLGRRNSHESAVSDQFQILKAKFIHYKFNVTTILKEEEYLKVIRRPLLSAKLLVLPKRPDVNLSVDVNPVLAAPYLQTILEVRNNNTLKPFIPCIQQYQFIDLLKAMYVREPDNAYMIGEMGKVYHHIELCEDDPDVLSVPISNETILILPLIYIDNDACKKELVNEDENDISLTTDQKPVEMTTDISLTTDQKPVEMTTAGYTSSLSYNTYTREPSANDEHLNAVTDKQLNVYDKNHTEPSSMATEKSLDAVPRETQSAPPYATNTTEPAVDGVTDDSHSTHTRETLQPSTSTDGSIQTTEIISFCGFGELTTFDEFMNHTNGTNTNCTIFVVTCFLLLFFLILIVIVCLVRKLKGDQRRFNHEYFFLNRINRLS